MALRLFCPALPRVVAAFLLMAGPVLAQDAAPGADSAGAAQLGSWLQPASVQGQAAPGESFHATSGTIAPDPFAVLTSGALWEETYGEIYTRDLGDAFTLSDETTDVVFEEDDADVARSEKLGLLFAPVPELSLSGNVHDTTAESLNPNDTRTTSGAGFSVESHLLSQSVVSVGLNFDHTIAEAPDALATETQTYHAQIQQPLGKLPVSAIFKGEFAGASAASLPSLEQSLVWKPLANTTVQLGLRQQQYQEYPGVDHALNEAIFADLSEKVLDNVSWHSYAELLNTKGLIDQAPASPIASGANGTPQANNPMTNTSLTSSMPLSFEDQTLTISTGPSVQLQKDISASLEYSNRWDKNPAPGSTGSEQRVSVSLKGTF